MKRIVIGCDGTWDRSGRNAENEAAPATNVVRLLAALAAADAAGTVQCPRYHRGVVLDRRGWGGWLGHRIGPALDHALLGLYRDLCDHYQDGDAIYLFGFSQGAFTARRLGGMIGRCGLLATAGLSDAEATRRIRVAFEHGYRLRRESWREGLGWPCHSPPAGQPRIPLRFLGVWDSVGPLGIPDDLARIDSAASPSRHGLHDTRLGDHVRTARHALALDEYRRERQPTLWTMVAPGRDVRQVWFPGGHHDVGGGRHPYGLSDGALRWMIDEAAATGLAFDPAMVGQIRPDPRDVMHAPTRPAQRGTMPRAIPDLLDFSGAIHPSVRERIAVAPIGQSPYRRPRDLAAGDIRIELDPAAPWNDTALYLKPGRCYLVHAEGTWRKSTMACTADGPSGPRWRAARIRLALNSLLGMAETMIRRLTRPSDSESGLARRHPDLPWLCLVGVIANGGLDGDMLVGHESFAIGTVPVAYVPQGPGYLHVYVNDRWGGYGDNQGHVHLIIRES